MKKLDYIKLEQLIQLKNQWKIDKTSSDYQFSPIEISAMEQKLSDAFLEYQIKCLQVNGAIPKEKVTDFVPQSEYLASIQRMITSSLESKDISPIDKLELDSLKNNSDSLFERFSRGTNFSEYAFSPYSSMFELFL